LKNALAYCLLFQPFKINVKVKFQASTVLIAMTGKNSGLFQIERLIQLKKYFLFRQEHYKLVKTSQLKTISMASAY
jgi:hypothetical protein